jgi:hypothetical protein
VLLQQDKGRFQVGCFAEPAARCGRVGVAAAELRSAGAVDPVQQPAGVVDAGVGAHQVEHGPGVLDQVAGQPDGAGEGVAANRAGPAVAQVAGQVQQASEPAGGAGELGRPAGQVGQVAAVGGQPWLQVTLEPQQQLPRRVVEGQQGGPVVAGGGGEAGCPGSSADVVSGTG